jgi:hypothetical protein
VKSWPGALVLAGLFLWLDPAKTLGSTLLERLPALCVAILVMLGLVGAGALLLQKLEPDFLKKEQGSWLVALGVGMGVGWVLVGVLAALKLLSVPGLVLILGLLLASWRFLKADILWPAAQPPLFIGACLLFFLPGLILALAPRTDTDEIYYHLAIPKLMLEQQGFVGGFLHPDGSRPLPTHLLFTLLLGLGGSYAPPLWHWLFSLAVVFGLKERIELHFGEGQGIIPVLGLLGSWSFLRETGLAYNNLSTALWLGLAADALLTSSWGRLAWFCGLALASKYTAASAVAGLLLVGALLFAREYGLQATVKKIPVILAGLLLPVLPWLLRNQWEGLHPLFPYTGWPKDNGIVFMYAEKYGMGRDWSAMLLLPWNLLMRAEPDSYRFLGRISLLWGGFLVLIPLSAFKSRQARMLLFVLLLGLTGWAAGPHWLRYLLPLSGVVVLAAGAASQPKALYLLFAASLPANLAPLLAQTADALPVVAGHEPEDSYLDRNVPGWNCIRYLKQHAPADAGVALFFTWPVFHLLQPAVVGSVEDHVPSRFLLFEHSEDPLGWLASQNIRYLVVGERPFLRKEYAFLDDSQFQRQFQQPVEALQKALLYHATRLYREGSYSVWVLP